MSSEENSNEISNEVFWKNLVVRYWYFVLIFGLIIIGAIIGFILTLDWYINTSTIGGQGTWTFDQFSMGTAIEWVIFLFLWILLIVVLPTLAVAGIIVAIIWFAVFPPELKEEIKLRFKKDEEHKKRRGKKSEGGGAFGFLMFIGVCIYVAIDGNWLTEFGSLNYRYFIDAWITVFKWALIIFGIPAVIIGIIWFVRKYGR
ncbi:MAG: hypothetical protein OEZ48_00475 [Candidatus Bathyarchaeota archaeon]|nr:hypothetical protein [Candidatus Bathyarchaeota archaeon]MDH5686331.1 hypothetical protein [Candidatus Bathyarchaeota archaeon]